MKLALATTLAVVCLAGAANADVVTLKNGDRITGTLVSEEAGTLQFNSDTMGAVSIPMAKIAAYTVTKPVTVVVKGQKPVEGTLQLAPNGDWLVTVNGKVLTIPASQVTVIMPADQYHKLVGTNPNIRQAWKGNASLGYNVQGGNQETNNIAVSIGAIRERPVTPIFIPHWRTNFAFTTLLSHASQDDVTVTSHVLTSNLQQEYLFTQDNFLFILAQVNHVSTQSLYLQQTYGGGYGRNLIKNARTTFSVSAGPTYVQQKFFTGLLTRSAQMLVAENLGMQLNKRLRLDHFFQIYPDLVKTGQYRFNTSTVVSAKLSTKFSANASVLDLYLSNPPVGSKGNNITYSMGIGYSF